MLAELDELAQALAERVQRAVAIDDPTMRLLVHTPHHGPVDQTRMQSLMRLRAEDPTVRWVLERVSHRTEDVFRLPANPERGFMSRICAPLRTDGKVLGYLWLIDDDGSLTDDQLMDIAETARAASRIMSHGGMPRDTSQVWERSLTADLFLPDLLIRAAAARSLSSLSDIHGPVQCVVLRLPDSADTPEAEEATYRALRRATGIHGHLGCLTLVEGGLGTIIVPHSAVTSGAIADIAAAARRELSEPGQTRSVLSGTGSMVNKLEQVDASRRQANVTLRVVERTGEFGTHATWSEIGAYRLLANVDRTFTLRELLPTQLAEMMSDPLAIDILNTVEVYLDYAGDVQGSIGTLNIHRTSLYYRLRRFGELSGLDLREGRARLVVHTAIKLARLAGWVPGDQLRTADVRIL